MLFDLYLHLLSLFYMGSIPESWQSDLGKLSSPLDLLSAGRGGGDHSDCLWGKVRKENAGRVLGVDPGSFIPVSHEA